MIVEVGRGATAVVDHSWPAHRLGQGIWMASMADNRAVWKGIIVATPASRVILADFATAVLRPLLANVLVSPFGRRRASSGGHSSDTAEQPYGRE